MREQHEEQQQKQNQEQQERQEMQLQETQQREHDVTAQLKEMHPKTTRAQDIHSRGAERYGSSRCRCCGRHVRRCGN
jgi:hypothetical protein